MNSKKFAVIARSTLPILSSGADPTLETEFNQTPLQVAELGGYREIVALLAKRQIDTAEGKLSEYIWLPVEGMGFRWASTVGRETLALLKILARGNQDTQAGRVKPVADVVARLRAKRETASPYICPRP